MKKNIKVTYTLEPHDKKRYIERINKKGLTQQEVAKKLGITYVMFSCILNGKRDINLEKFIELESML